MEAGIRQQQASLVARGLYLVAAVVLLLLSIGILITKPVLLFALAIVVPAILVALFRPDWYTLFAIGIIYCNAAVVAVRFHGAPLIVGIAVPLLLGIPIGWQWIRGKPLVIDLVGQLLVLFCLSQLFSTLSSDATGISLGDVTETVCEGLLLYLLVFNAVRTHQQLRQLTWVLLFAGTTMGSVCCFQHVTRTYDRTYGGFAQTEENPGFETSEVDYQGKVRQRRLSGPIGSQNRFAQIMLMLVPLGLCRIWAEKSTCLRATAVVFTGTIGLGLMLTFSRGTAVGFAILIAVMLFLGYIKLRQSFAIAVGVGLLLLMVPQFATRFVTLGTLLEAARSDAVSMEESDGSLRSRAAEALAALMMLADHPWTGVGPGMYPHHYQHYAAIAGSTFPGLKIKEERRQPHVLYLGIAAELGLPGLIVFCSLLVVLLLRLEHVRQASLIAGRTDIAWLLAGFLLAIVAYLATGLFLHLSYVRYFWLMVALASAAAAVGARAIHEAEPMVGRSPALIGSTSA